MCAARPLQIPRKVRFAGGLGTLFGDTFHPLLAEQDAIKSIRLEDAEGDDGSESACDEEK